VSDPAALVLVGPASLTLRALLTSFDGDTDLVDCGPGDDIAEVDAATASRAARRSSGGER